MKKEQLQRLKAIKDNITDLSKILHDKVDNKELTSDQKSYLLGQAVSSFSSIADSLEDLYKEIPEGKIFYFDIETEDKEFGKSGEKIYTGIEEKKFSNTANELASEDDITSGGSFGYGYSRYMTDLRAKQTKS